jgi:hypothetical protein
MLVLSLLERRIKPRIISIRPFQVCARPPREDAARPQMPEIISIDVLRKFTTNRPVRYHRCARHRSSMVSALLPRQQGEQESLSEDPYEVLNTLMVYDLQSETYCIHELWNCRPVRSATTKETALPVFIATVSNVLGRQHFQTAIDSGTTKYTHLSTVTTTELKSSSCLTCQRRHRNNLQDSWF